MSSQFRGCLSLRKTRFLHSTRVGLRSFVSKPTFVSEAYQQWWDTGFAARERAGLNVLMRRTDKLAVPLQTQMSSISVHVCLNWFQE